MVRFIGFPAWSPTLTKLGWGTHSLRWSVVVSHPFARKKAKRWGTEIRAGQRKGKNNRGSFDCLRCASVAQENKLSVVRFSG